MCIYSHKLRATVILAILAIYSKKLRATRDICDCSVLVSGNCPRSN